MVVHKPEGDITLGLYFFYKYSVPADTWRYNYLTTTTERLLTLTF